MSGSELDCSTPLFCGCCVHEHQFTIQIVRWFFNFYPRSGRSSQMTVHAKKKLARVWLAIRYELPANSATVLVVDSDVTV